MWSTAERRVAARWTRNVALGEALGFAIATTVALTVILVGVPGIAGLGATVAGGVLEGTVLAIAQYSAMRANRPPHAAWVAATAAGAGLAWTLGMLPSTLGLDLGAPITWVEIVVGAVVLLASIPVAQALVLRRRGSVRWALHNAGAWAVAILWTFAPSPFINESTPVPLVAGCYVVAGLLMALTIALLTAPVAVRLFAEPSAVAVGAPPLRRVDGGLGAPLHPEFRQ